MAEVDTDLEATREKQEKEEKERLEKEEKARQAKWEKALAIGKYAGGKLTKGTFAGAESLSELYVGLGPLAVPCTRGEQKAVSGDTIVTIWIDRPEPEDDIEYIFIIPGIPGKPVDTKPGLTNSEHQTFLRTREERLEKKSRKLDKSTAERAQLGTSQPSGTTNQPSTTQASSVRPPVKPSA